MNSDAEKWIEHYQSVQEPGDHLDHEALRDAMKWAYADAANTASIAVDIYSGNQPCCLYVRQKIEERAK